MSSENRVDTKVLIDHAEFQKPEKILSDKDRKKQEKKQAEEKRAEEKKIEKEQSQQKKAQEKAFKNSNYCKIIKKFPKYKVQIVFDNLKDLLPLPLQPLKEGRVIKTNSVVRLDNSIYIGEVNENSIKDGLGYLLQCDGSYYEGFFTNGKFQGRGRLITSEGKIIEGIWDGNSINGEGTIITHDPYSKYVGEIDDNLPERMGKLVTADKTVYEGAFHIGKPHGKGVIKFVDGSWYDGEFFKGKQSGKGTFHYVDGSIATGNWENNKLHGQGEKRWKDGIVFEGEFEDGVINGHGKMIWLDGRSYEGFWNNGTFHGKGTETKANGDVICGNWKFGKLIDVISETIFGKEKKIPNNSISRSSRELEEKVKKTRERMISPNNKEFSTKLTLFNARQKVKIMSNLVEKEKRQIERAEKAIVEQNTKRNLYVWDRIPNKAEDDKKITKLLNFIEFHENLAKFSVILKKRAEFGDFDYDEPDLSLPENLAFIENFIQLDEKTFYKGETSEKGPCGRGFLLKKREIYEGYFEDGKKQGLGRKITLKYQYTGYWQMDKKSGFGVKRKKDSCYVGDFENDSEHGEGYYKDSIHSYRGNWEEGLKHGLGELKSNDGSVFIGDFQEGKIQGFGRLIYKSGNGIAGYWENGKIVGVPEKLNVKEFEIKKLETDEDLDKSYDESYQNSQNFNERSLKIENILDIEEDV